MFCSSYSEKFRKIAKIPSQNPSFFQVNHDLLKISKQNDKSTFFSLKFRSLLQ